MGGRGPRNIKGAPVAEAAFSSVPNVFLLLPASNSFRFFEAFCLACDIGDSRGSLGQGIPNSGNTIKN